MHWLSHYEFIIITCGEIFTLIVFYFCMIIYFLTKSLTLTTGEKAVVIVFKLVTLGILSSLYMILAL